VRNLSLYAAVSYVPAVRSLQEYTVGTNQLSEDGSWLAIYLLLLSVPAAFLVVAVAVSSRLSCESSEDGNDFFAVH